MYDDILSRKYNLIIANLTAERMIDIAGQKSGNFVFNKALKSRYLIDDDYTNSPLSFEVEIVTCNDRALELREMREIENWLFTNSTFKKLYVDMDDDPFGETYELVYGLQQRLYLNCRFLNAEKLEYNGGVIGFRCTLETDGMMLWQDPVSLIVDLGEPIYVEIEGERIMLLRGDVNFDGEISVDDAQMTLQEYANILAGKPGTFTELQNLAADMDEDGYITPSDAQTILQMYTTELAMKPIDKGYIIIDEEGTKIPLGEGTKLISFIVDSDIDGYTYPTIEIKISAAAPTGTGNDVSITNLSDDTTRKTTFTNVAPDATIIIDSSTHRVSNNYYSDMTSKNFPRLINGTNDLLVEGASVVYVKITWQNRRYL